MKIVFFILFLLPSLVCAEDFKALKSIYCNKLSSVELIKLAKIKNIYSQVKQVSEQFKPVLDKMPEPQKKQILEKLKEQDLVNNLNLLCVALDADCDFDDIKSLDAFVSEIEKIQSMAEALVKSSANEAINQTVDCLSINPGDVTLNFNFALALSFADDNKKSIESFNDLLIKLESAQTQMTKEDYNEIKFYILFNLGVLYSQESDVSNALSKYQQALEIQPESKEIKTNIELLFQQQQQQQQGQKNQQGQQGDNPDQKNNQQQKEKEEQNEKNPDNKQNKNKQNNQQQDFKSKKLTKDDVRKILEELKNQENKIRMNEYQKGDKSQENDNGKNW